MSTVGVRRLGYQTHPEVVHPAVMRRPNRHWLNLPPSVTANVAARVFDGRGRESGTKERNMGGRDEVHNRSHNTEGSGQVSNNSYHHTDNGTSDQDARDHVNVQAQSPCPASLQLFSQ
ncbi:hypothetical protein ECG_06482 [Echinococcus granulosus]|uniref:Expressed protein n=1 Tax=Echinococcus granulosus TaxID=6210 RepID=A0A068WP66_ECHGR|nr:hypothetical protein ECG_06482 [Echinococcus granulosus]CDS19427.1 expressed protein [Echinococcus granulosus]